MHVQLKKPQAKLITVTYGKIFDVAVDLRKKSKTFGKYVSQIISQKDDFSFYIPEGFAHGFLVLSESAILSYKVDNYYNSRYESGIIWNDTDLNIDWKISKAEIIVSEKDTKLPVFNNFLSPFE